MEDIKFQLNEKTHYQDYLNSLEDIKTISDLTGDTDEITTHIDMGSYSISNSVAISKEKFIDFSIFSDYKNTWYSWVRVVFYIAFVLFNINEIIRLLNSFGFVSSFSGGSKDLQGGSDKK